MIDVETASSPATPGRMPMLRFGRPVVAAMLLVVVSFALSLGYSHLRLRPVSQQALTVIDDAVPSIERIAAAQTALTRFGMNVSEYVLGPAHDPTVTRADIGQARRALDAELAEYRELLSARGEAEQLAEVERDLALLDESVKAVLDSADRGLSTASRALHESLHPRLLQIEEAFGRLETMNTKHARTSAVSILQATRDAAFFATALGISSLVVASTAMVLVLRVLRVRARLMEEHAQLLAARATELEAFAGRVAHDLKNPLGALALRVLSSGRRPDLNPALRDDFDRMTRLVEHMDRIIDGLLEFARAGANAAEGARADVREVIDEVVSELRPAADTASAELRVEPFAPLRLACTRAALTSILSNLIGNAVKYIALGTQVPRRIVVRVKDRAGSARIEIDDNGPGLPPGSEQRAFEPFRRLAVESNQPGIGLGLATVKKFVEAYGGRVGVESRPGHGSTFWFELPKPASDERSLPHEPRERAPDLPHASA